MKQNTVHIRKFQIIGYDPIFVINANMLHCLQVNDSYNKINVAGVKHVSKKHIECSFNGPNRV